MTSTGYRISAQHAVGRPQAAFMRGSSPAQFRIGEIFADTALQCVSEGPPPRDIDAVCSHGQTLVHLPEADHPVIPCRATLQIGDISVIAQRTGILTIGDFRPADMAQQAKALPLHLTWTISLSGTRRWDVLCRTSEASETSPTSLPMLSRRSNSV